MTRGIARLRFAAAVGALLAVLATAPVAAASHGGPVPVLMYHRVARAAPFERQMAALERAGHRAVTLERVWSAWHGGRALPPRAFVITFDDGYTGQYAHAAPALAARAWPAVLDLTVDRIGAPGGLTAPEVSALVARGWELAAHTLTHPDLRRVGARRLAREVGGSRAELERRFGVPVRFFCLPYGRSDVHVRAAIRAAGYLGAVSIRPGAAAPWDDALDVRRIHAEPRMPPRLLLRRIAHARRLALEAHG